MRLYQCVDPSRQRNQLQAQPAGTATFPFAMEALVAAHPAWQLLVALLNFVGSAAFSLFL
jgi:hypothetical protein